MSLKEIIIREIRKIKTEIVSPLAIQVPEGLKQFSTLILEELKDYSPALFVDPCYGACDIKFKEAKELGCKTLIHFGHRQLPGLKTTKALKIIYVPLDFEYSNEQIDFIVSEIKKQELKKISLVTTVQYLSNIPLIKEKLQKENIDVLELRKQKDCKSTRYLVAIVLIFVIL